MTPVPNHRILLVDDNPAIHDDFRKILIPSGADRTALDEAEAILFDAPKKAVVTATDFDLDSAYQGKEALERLTQAVQAGRPYAMAFVDVRMPPGWDGIETIERLWKVDPALQVVICTAYSDYSWEKMSARLGVNDNLLILKKPFDNIEVLQLAHALTKKWLVTQQAQMKMDVLDTMVADRTRELQSANTELRRSEERFLKAFRSSPVSLAILTLHEDRFVDVNEAFLEMTGYQREELVGSTPLEVRLLMDFDSAVFEAIREGKPVRNVEAQFSHRNNGVRQTLVSMERITIADDPHVLLMAQDISERLRLEAQLRQSQKMEAIGQLAAGVAHDFNNLLTIIEGHASLQLATPDLSQDLTESLEQIEQAAERAADLTRQLLAFSRRQIMRPRVLDLNALIRDLATMLRRLIGERIELRCELLDTLPPVCADQTSIEQILMNLTLNARDAMPKGGEIKIETKTIVFHADETSRHFDAMPGEYVCLSVTDTGIGMDDATRARIFEPFFTTKEVNKGTGMGLATVYGIVRQHDGWIDVATAPEEGSTFRIFLPITDKLPEPSSEVGYAHRRANREHTILIVEDDPAVRGLVKEVLVHHQYRVLEAENADTALAIWKEFPGEIELLLTDMVMPGSANGLELSQQLLADNPKLKIIYTSGYSAELFSSDVKLQEGHNYLPKPYLSSKLTSILRSALEPENSETSAVRTF